MFTLKKGYEFGQLLRRENENVSAGLTEEALACNLDQILRVLGLPAQYTVVQGAFPRSLRDLLRPALSQPRLPSRPA